MASLHCPRHPILSCRTRNSPIPPPRRLDASPLPSADVFPSFSRASPADLLSQLRDPCHRSIRQSLQDFDQHQVQPRRTRPSIMLSVFEYSFDGIRIPCVAIESSHVVSRTFPVAYPVLLAASEFIIESSAPLSSPPLVSGSSTRSASSVPLSLLSSMSALAEESFRSSTKFPLPFVLRSISPSVFPSFSCQGSPARRRLCVVQRFPHAVLRALALSSSESLLPRVVHYRPRSRPRRQPHLTRRDNAFELQLMFLRAYRLQDLTFPKARNLTTPAFDDATAHCPRRFHYPISHSHLNHQNLVFRVHRLYYSEIHLFIKCPKRV